jgi:hypothetical protein
VTSPPYATDIYGNVPAIRRAKGGTMAFGIDDALTAATAGLKITETLVEIIKKHRGRRNEPDFERLLAEVKNTALSRVNDAFGVNPVRENPRRERC